MPIDINTFRTMSANTDGSNILYVQGDKLKSTTTQRLRSSDQFESFKAATTAFLDSFKAHYGAALGKTAGNTLREYVEMGRPLSASVVSQLITFAAFKFDKDGKVDVKGAIHHLATFHAYIDREIDARHIARVRPSAPMREPTAPADVNVQNAAPAMSDAEIRSAKLFEKGIFTAVDAMDNNELSAVYQGLISGQADALKRELHRIMTHPETEASVRNLAERSFADISRIEAMVVSEISRRMELDRTPDDQKANVPSLMAKYVGEDANPANHFGGEQDMTTVNLGLVTRMAAKGSNDEKTASAKTNETLKSHNLGTFDSRKIGDMLRSHELTVNMHFAALNTSKLTSGGADTQQSAYGRVVVVLKPHVKQKCTYTLDDSFMAVRYNLPESRRAEIEERLVAAFADRLRDPAAALEALRTQGGDGAKALDNFFVNKGYRSENITGQGLDDLFGQLARALSDLEKEGAEPITSAEVTAYFSTHYLSAQETRKGVADYDHIENLVAQQEAITPVSMAISTLRQIEDPKKPYCCDGISYIEAQIHGPVLLERDVEEIRISLDEMTDYYEAEFDKLPEHERNAIKGNGDFGEDEDERVGNWVMRKCEATKAEILADAAGKPYKVTFYARETMEAESEVVSRELVDLAKESVAHLKDDLAADADSFLCTHRDDIIRNVLHDLKNSVHANRFYEMCGRSFERMPIWLWKGIDARLRAEIASFGENFNFINRQRVRSGLIRVFHETLDHLGYAMSEMDKLGIADEAERQGVLEELMRFGMPNSENAKAFVRLHAAAKNALADVNATARETLLKDVEGGANMLSNAFNGLPPLAGVAKDFVTDSIRREIAAVKMGLSNKSIRGRDMTPEALAERIRRNAVMPFLGKKAGIMQSQTFMKFPTMEERNAFLLWATSAGQLKNIHQFEGAATFIEMLHNHLSYDYGFALHPTSDTNSVDYKVVPPDTRQLVLQINPEQAASLNRDFPYNPVASGARSLLRIPASANPNAMPQTNAQRKAFLLEMLPTYHNHEKTFDKGTNYHGRTHATRSFVFSIAMGNILKERGVTVDLNAVALATAGHDTGRLNNANDDLDERKFPFLQKPIVTEDGLIVDMDSGKRRQLMKEALLLAQRTDPRCSRGEELRRLSANIADLERNGASDNEILAAQNVRDELNAELSAKEREQTANLSDQRIVDLVEDVIRSSPKDFPLLTKYYLNAE